LTRPKRCVDCVAEGITTNRKPALWKGKPVPGSRCSTHHRARRGQTRDLSWERRLIQTYGITAEEYWQIYEFQQGRCYICGRGKGARKRLAVDHDHATGMVRGLLDQPCNRNILGHLRDDPEALQRAIEYLKNPPAVQVLGERIAPIEALRLTSNGSEDA
jgi:hypothetical protein